MTSLLYLRCTYKILQNLKVMQCEKLNLSMSTMRKIQSLYEYNAKNPIFRNIC